MLPVAKFAWERLEFILAPPQDKEKQQQVGSTSQVACCGIRWIKVLRAEGASCQLVVMAINAYRQPSLAQSCRLLRP